MALVTILFFIFFGILFYLLYYLNYKNSSRLVIASLITTLVFIFLLGCLLYDSLSILNKVKDYNKLGPFGDYIGGLVNPLISVFAVVAAGFAFFAQYEANKQVQQQFKIQQFESQFYEMLRLHKENINEMNITGYYKSIEMTTECSMSDSSKKITRTEKQADKFITGRKVFVSMINELIFCCDFCIEFNKLNGKKFSKDDMLELGYKIFFHGSNSKFIANNVVNGNFIKSIKEELKKIRKEHKKTHGTYNLHTINNKPINLNIKYSPFTGHVSRLGHYYRHLFYMVKFVVKNENEKLFDYKKSREYLKLLRAQMSNDEQLLLYYNYKIGFGEKWEDEENKFLSKYRMLHNLPTGKVKYNNPLAVFNEQIQKIRIDTNEKETMFEWGDD